MKRLAAAALLLLASALPAWAQINLDGLPYPNATTAGTTGTGKFVLQTSPTLITPNVGVASGTSLALSGSGVALTVNSSTTPSGSFPTGTIAEIASAGATTFNVDAVGAIALYTGRRTNTSFGSPSGITTDQSLAGFGGLGYGSTAYPTSTRGNMKIVAGEAWSDTLQGAYITFSTTATGGTSTTEKMRIFGSGGVSIGNTTDPGFGSLSVSAGATNPVLIGQWGLAATYGCLSLNNSLSGTAGTTFCGGGDANAYFNVATGGGYISRINNVTVLTWDAASVRPADATTALGDATHRWTNGFFSGNLNVSAMTQTSAAQSGTVCYNSGTGAVTYDASLGCLSSTSRIKRDIAPLGGGLDTIMALRPATFYRTDKDAPNGQQIGLVAEDVAAVDRRLAAFEPDGHARGWSQSAVIAELVAAVQQTNGRIDRLRP